MSSAPVNNVAESTEKVVEAMEGNARHGLYPTVQENPPPSYSESGVQGFPPTVNNINNPGQAIPMVSFPPGQPVYPPAAGYPAVAMPGLPGYPQQMVPAAYAQQGFPGAPIQGMVGYPPQGVPGGYPIMTQPQPLASNWMQAPPAPPGCPPGLEYLSTIDTLLVQQQVELLEVITGFETENKYLIKNNEGQNVYMAAEESNCCQRQCCGSIREFQMNIVDNYQNQLISIHRPLKCQGCCCFCCLQFLEVTSPPGTVIGTVEQICSIIRPIFNIKDAAENIVLKIRGPICTCSCSDVIFQIFDPSEKTVVGHVTKKWSGFVKEACTDADNFRVSFPKDLDVKLKAVLLGACFLIDFMYFENSNSKSRR